MPGPAFSIRISEFSEIDGGFVPGAYYRFESLRPDGTGWANALEFRHDDPVPPPKENVKFINAGIAFIFMGWKYAVTTDGARHWTVWNAQADLPGWQCCNYGLIKRVALDASGTGRMVLNPIPGRAGEVGELFTSDFGRHWAARAVANRQ